MTPAHEMCLLSIVRRERDDSICGGRRGLPCKNWPALWAMFSPRSRWSFLQLCWLPHPYFDLDALSKLAVQILSLPENKHIDFTIKGRWRFGFAIARAAPTFYNPEE